MLLEPGVVGAVDDEAYREYVVYAFEGHFLHLHLAVDGECALGARLQLVFYAGFRELALEGAYEFGGQLLAVLFGGLELVGDGPVLLGVGVAEVDVAELRVDVVEAELVGQRHVEHGGLQQFLVAGTLGEHAQVAHYLEAVGDLEHDDAGVAGVLDYQFLVVLGLEARVLGLDRGNLVEAVDYRAHVLGEGADVDVLVDAGGFVEVDRGHAFVRQPDFVFHYAGDAVGMTDEGRAVVAGLVRERRSCDGACLFDKIVHYGKYSLFSCQMSRCPELKRGCRMDSNICAVVLDFSGVYDIFAISK